MIEKISFTNVNKKNTLSQVQKTGGNVAQPSFKGGPVDLLVAGVQQCEKHPMINVSVLDLVTAILPRTYFETTTGSKKKDENGKEERKLNINGGFEAFRRESSGLIVNCLIPSFIVIGAAKLLNWPLMGKFNKSNLTTTWANSDAYDKIKVFYEKASGANNEDKLYNTFKRMLVSVEGVNGNAETGGMKGFREIFAKNPNAVKDLTDIDEILKKIELKPEVDEAFKKLAKASLEKKPELAKEAYKTISEMTHITENIRFIGDKKYSSNNLESACRDTVKVLKGVTKEGITSSNELGKYFAKAKKLVTLKSVAGLGLIIPLAMSMQAINRKITHKLSGQKGAPIYNDENGHKELSKDEKKKLFSQKIVSIGSMVGVAALSMIMDKPSLKMFQFKGLFPTMDQARIISTATFAGRMAASEDANDLREATIRDIATFASFYFLGDYAAKGIATFIEARDSSAKLINKMKNAPKDANIFKKFWNWAKHTSLKSTDELATAKDKKLRTICQLGNLAFSLIALGVFIPLYTRTQTNKKRQQELAKSNSATSNANPSSGADVKSSSGAGISAGTTSFDGLSNMSKLPKNNPAFKTFLNS